MTGEKEALIKIIESHKKKKSCNICLHKNCTPINRTVGKGKEKIEKKSIAAPRPEIL